MNRLDERVDDVVQVFENNVSPLVTATSFVG
jgi:hypothetical protein